MQTLNSKQPQIDYSAILKSHSNDEIFLRELEATDYNKGFFEALKVLSHAGANNPYKYITESEFLEIYENSKNSTYLHKVIVAENLKETDVTKKVIGTGSILVEPKFIRMGGKAGHIEDIAVNEGHQGKNIGKKIVCALKDIGVVAGCYKVILDCSDKNEGFYVKCGFELKGIQMAYYVTDEGKKALADKLGGLSITEKSKL